MRDTEEINPMFVERMCECCGRRPYTVAVSNPYAEGRDYSERLYCDDCHIAVFGSLGRPRGELS